jgi:hypothetical protein
MYAIPHAKQRAYQRFSLTGDDMNEIGRMIECGDCYELNSYGGRTNYLVNYNGADYTVTVSNRRNVIITIMTFTVHKVFGRI